MFVEYTRLASKFFSTTSWQPGMVTFIVYDSPQKENLLYQAITIDHPQYKAAWEILKGEDRRKIGVLHSEDKALVIRNLHNEIVSFVEEVTKVGVSIAIDKGDVFLLSRELNGVIMPEYDVIRAGSPVKFAEDQEALLLMLILHLVPNLQDALYMI